MQLGIAPILVSFNIGFAPILMQLGITLILVYLMQFIAFIPILI
jgi:ABC-type long-subunit fatty acid transport system fused permease/ATPase subunit